MDIFISYSTSDLHLVQRLAEQLQPHANVHYWDESKVLGKDSWEQIFTWVDIADFVVVLITGNTVTRAMAVGQEVGRAKAKDKTIIPVVSKEMPISELGFLAGITYQQIDVVNPTPALAEINKYAALYKQDIERNKAIMILLLVVGALIWLFNKE